MLYFTPSLEWASRGLDIYDKFGFAVYPVSEDKQGILFRDGLVMSLKLPALRNGRPKLRPTQKTDVVDSPYFPVVVTQMTIEEIAQALGITIANSSDV